MEIIFFLDMKQKVKIFNEIKAYIVIAFGLFIVALGWTAFLIPNEILGGGVTGIATLVFWATGLPVGVSVLAVNAVLLAIALRILGVGFSLKTIVSVAVLSGMFSVLQYYIREPFVTDRFMAAIIGGIMGGAGIGIVFTQGGSTGGTDIVALIINKYRNISPGKIILILDVFIISSSFILFRSIETLVYGFVVMAVASYVIDLILTGNKQSVQLFIFSKKADEIANRIGKETGRGVTFIKGTGWYTKTESNILLIIVRRMESPQIFRIIKEIDPDAFMSLNNVMGVYGNGFDSIK
ncbi:MAG: YitT family protein [Bacteroidales bacterium]|nr:YitT family protein [Bacteroidales bacterium]